MLVVSARDDYDELRPRMLDQEVFDYLVKPVDPETILIKVRRLLHADLERRGAGIKNVRIVELVSKLTQRNVLERTSRTAADSPRRGAGVV